MKRAVISAVLAASSGFTGGTQRPSRSGNAMIVVWPTEPNRRSTMPFCSWYRFGLLRACPIYLWHRRTKIETTSGSKASFSDLLMMADMAPVVLSGVFLEVNAGTLAIMVGWLILTPRDGRVERRLHANPPADPDRRTAHAQLSREGPVLHCVVRALHKPG